MTGVIVLLAIIVLLLAFCEHRLGQIAAAVENLDARGERFFPMNRFERERNRMRAETENW